LRNRKRKQDNESAEKYYLKKMICRTSASKFSHSKLECQKKKKLVIILLTNTKHIHQSGAHAQVWEYLRLNINKYSIKI